MLKRYQQFAFSELWHCMYNYMDFVVQDPRFMRPSEVPYLKGSAYKAKVVLGWEPKVDFEELVSRMVEYDIKQAKEKEMIG